LADRDLTALQHKLGHTAHI